MSSRAEKILKLAKILTERAKAKENVRGYVTEPTQNENIDTANINNGEKNNTSNIELKEDCHPYDILQNNFEPNVQNETQTSYSDPEFLKSSGVVNLSFPAEPKLIEEIGESAENFYEQPEWENSDDSVKDPDFNVSLSSDNDSQTSLNVSLENEEINRLGTQIENALVTPKKSNKLLRSKLRNNGKSYDTISGKKISPRKCIPFGMCRNKCKEKIGFDKIQSLFEHYWSLGSYDRRILYIGSLIRVESKKCDTLVNSHERKRKRENTTKYTLEFDGKVVGVCRKHFLQCFNETDSFAKSVIRKKIGCPIVSFRDHRGEHTPINKTCSKKEDEVKLHILEFPAYESHYSRRDTSKKYLHASLSLSSMHALYKEKFDNPLSLSKYSQIFKTMGIKFKAPKVDTCSTCDGFVLKIKVSQSEEEKTVFMDKKSMHLDKAEMAYAAKRDDKIEAMSSRDMKVFAFDLQQCLPTPFLRNSISFYKRQLWTFNLTVHDLETNKAQCFMWHEAMARRGGNEISSCLYKLLSTISADTNRITFYSDSCTGQNKNSFVAAMFLAKVFNTQNLDYIDHKFLEPGHTHMECDSDHALIERKKKKTNVEIQVPRDWYQFVNTVGHNIEVVEMKSDDFLNFSDLSKQKFNWKRFNEDGERFTWNTVRWLRYTKCLNKVFYKTSLDSTAPFKILKIGKRSVSFIPESEIKKIDEVPCISQEKKRDLVFLKQFINPEFHTFYDNLRTNMGELNTHPDLTETDNEEDV